MAINFLVPKPECILDSDCSNDKSCINQNCRNPCLENICGNNAECRVQLHRPICICREGFTGNAQVACLESMTPLLNYQMNDSYRYYLLNVFSWM